MADTITIMDYRIVDTLNADQLEVGDLIGLADEVVEVVNILFFGVWWLYDLAHAAWSKDVIKVYGLGVPGLGPQGIAAGVLMKEEPDKDHWR